MALEVYRKKRQFGVTPEPRGRERGRGARGGGRYVIQKHAARRLHYDLRLELDGVMKSWAVTRGPSLDPGEKRLAVRVEDHPIEYNTFEGVIPVGEYGGGTVMIWDRGRWIPDGDPHQGFAKGHLTFELDGEKLHGRWHLVRMRGRPNESRENWLLIKGRDEDARSGRGGDILKEEARSVASGRSMEEIAAGKRSAHRRARTKTKTRSAAKPAVQMKSDPAPSAGGRRARLPDFIAPSLAVLHESAPSGPRWLHEIKYDGYRIEARLDRGKVQLLTRHRQDWTHRFKQVAEAVAALPAETALLDGELVVQDEKGISSFSLLQTDLKEGRSDRFVYWVFDLLYLDGRDLTALPLVERKTTLQKLLRATRGRGPVRYAEHFDEDGPLIFKHACKMGLEGIVSKRREAPYFPGRSENFIKSKCRDEQEFVVAGFAPSNAMPQAVGALVAAFHENGKLRYAGRIGTGFSHDTARDLWKRLQKLRADKPPVALPKSERRKNVIWVKPQVVIEAEYRGLTHDGLLRQAAYKGLREDKRAREVVREAPASRVAPVAAAQQRIMGKSKNASSSRLAGIVTGPAKAFAARAETSADIGEVYLTHRKRVYWAEVGVTKEDLAAYYMSVWNWMAPHVVGRPLALLRCPEGTGRPCFFQKHIGANIKQSALRHAVPAKERDVIAIEDLDDLLALVQGGTLEIHARGSRLDALEFCDRLVFDLDPGQGVPWDAIVAAARETRQRLKDEKLESFVKLSGGKGIHVVAPIADAGWEAAKNFTQRIALSMAADSPRLYVAEMRKSLRDGRIFIDYLRNTREATSIAPYSTRARQGAPVSAPLSWEQLGRATASNEFTVLNLKRHFRADPWRDIGKVKQRLPQGGPRRG
jgi:bifunctional non-homologous end joining protein LigD